MTTPTVEILTAVDAVIKAARELHDNIPEDIVVVLASGKHGRGGMKHGHFAPGSWKDGASEIFLGAESFKRGAVPTLGTILHELSHAIAYKSGVKDTSNKGRYHNGKFKEIANDLGIHVEKDGTIGWSVTTVPDATRDKYAEVVKTLDAALTTYREGLPAGVEVAKPKKPAAKTKKEMDCGCNDPVSVSIKWFESHGQYVTCDVCGDPFELRESK